MVFPGTAPVNIIVAPNSPIALVNARMLPAMIPLHESGRVIVRKVRSGCAPSKRAVRSSLGSTAPMEAARVLTNNGKDTTADARVTARQVKIISIPMLFKGLPMNPVSGLKTTRSRYPTTVGGSTIGIEMIELTTPVYRHLLLDINQLIPMPGMKISSRHPSDALTERARI